MTEIDRLLEIMARLRDPQQGCPWDLEQDFSTIAPHTVEEAYEVADAIERNDLPGLRNELGDLLFQVVFHARLAEESGEFSFADVVNGLCDKMTRRHPHVFADASVANAEAQTIAWEAQKAAERQTDDAGVLDDVPRALPALRRAAKLGSRAASVGFDWPSAAGARAKINEELAELDAEIATGNRTAIERETGDLLLAIVNLARHMRFDPETALQTANNRFRARFRHLERSLAEAGRRPEQADLDELETLWRAAKDALSD
ncbi:MAG: nucleoside triphosphate pyrophosphohydrolase [Gammaproteobacteria bacterium]|nr:nucleoside triphosphate pyrophosphohydrolase [Gammaproteobacteria bacterium]MDH3768108.1 nucleoside triphosphate pyrophosphohydrolase [Gammaproteobacteria bacterium]